MPVAVGVSVATTAVAVSVGAGVLVAGTDVSVAVAVPVAVSLALAVAVAVPVKSMGVSRLVAFEPTESCEAYAPAAARLTSTIPAPAAMIFCFIHPPFSSELSALRVPC